MMVNLSNAEKTFIEKVFKKKCIFQFRLVVGGEYKTFFFFA